MVFMIKTFRESSQLNLHLNQLHGMDASFPVAFFLLLGNGPKLKGADKEELSSNKNNDY